MPASRAWIPAVAAIVALLAGYALAYAVYTPKVAHLYSEVESWKAKYSNTAKALSRVQAEYEELKDKYSKLQSSYTELKKNYENLKERYSNLEKKYASAASELEKLREEATKFERQAREVLYYRLFSLYDYTTDTYYYVWYKVRAADYFHYRFDVETHRPATLEDRLTAKAIQKAAGSWRDPESEVIREIASDLLDISGGDPELFANLALQIVHQICYNATMYTKYPVETLVEGSGDCDNVAVLLASILRAGGLKTLVLLVDTPAGAHAMVAVALPHPPRDIASYGRTAWYYEYNGEKYYLAEATWPCISEDYRWVDPATPEALQVCGSLVGDNPWGENLQIVQAIEVP